MAGKIKYPKIKMKAIFKHIHIMVLILLLMALEGCSSFGYQNYFSPIPENSWKVTGAREDPITLFGNSYDERHDDVTAIYQCNWKTLKISDNYSYGVGAFGPPVIPVIPIWGQGEQILSLEVQDKHDPWTEWCPEVSAINLNNSKFELFKKYEHFLSSTYYCKYKISGVNFKEIDQLKLQFKFEECKTKPLLYKKKQEIYYCMACFPQVAG